MVRKSKVADSESSQSTYPCSGLVEGLSKFADYVTFNLPPGPAFIKMNYVINSLKGLTGVYLFILMCIYDNFSLGAWVYLTVHGSYGFCWILKDLIFPDSHFGCKISITSAMLPILVMLIYLLPGKTLRMIFRIQND